MKKSTILSIMAMVMLGWAAGNACAAEITVADGTATNEKCPIESYYNDSYVHHQLIYPASLLEGMNGSISALTFYVSTVAGKTIDGVYNVGLAVVAEDYFDGGWSDSYAYLDAELSVVYQGAIDGSQETVKLDFESPFSYTGGNLLVDIRTESPGSNYADAAYAGMETAAVQSVRAGYMFDMPSQPAGGDAFLPKTTFTYTEGSATGNLSPTLPSREGVKTLRNGVLVIEHNGTTYDVQGAVLK